MEPMIGCSLKSWLKKKKSTQKNRKQSLQNQKFSQISRSVVEGRAGIAMISAPSCFAHSASFPNITSSAQERHWHCSPLSFISGHWLLPYTFPHVFFLDEIWCYKSYDIGHQSQGLKYEGKIRKLTTSQWDSEVPLVGEETKRTPRVSYLPVSILISLLLPPVCPTRQQARLGSSHPSLAPQPWASLPGGTSESCSAAERGPCFAKT